MDSEDRKQGLSWIFGHAHAKPWSITQSTIFCEIHGGAAKYRFDPYAHKLRQLHRSRLSVTVKHKKKGGEHDGDRRLDSKNEEKEVLRVLLNELSSVVKISTNRTPHLEFGGGASSSVDIIDGKIVACQKKHSFSFCQIEPHLAKSIRTIFSINNAGQNRFGKFDVFYLPESFPSESFNSDVGKKYSYRATLFLIPPKENKLCLYSLVNGELLTSVSLGSVSYSEIICQENGKILLQAKKSSIPSDVEQDLLMYSYPPLKLSAHVQIKKTAMRRHRLKSLEFWEDFIAGKAAKMVMLFDLEKELEQAKVDSQCLDTPDLAIEITHILKEFETAPLLCIPTVDEFLFFSTNNFLQFVSKTAKDRYQFLQLSNEGPLVVPFDRETELHLPATLLDNFTPVNMLRNYGPRILVNHGANIRIFGARGCSSETISPSNSSMKVPKFELLFDKSFMYSSREKEAASLSASSSRNGLRERKARVSYENDMDLQLEFAENETFMQIAIVRFAPNSIECSIFDSFNYNQIYSLIPHAFKPKRDEIYNHILIDFYDDFIAVKQYARPGEKKIFTFNLLRGLE